MVLKYVFMYCYKCNVRLNRIFGIQLRLKVLEHVAVYLHIQHLFMTTILWIWLAHMFIKLLIVYLTGSVCLQNPIEYWLQVVLILVSLAKVRSYNNSVRKMKMHQVEKVLLKRDFKPIQTHLQHYLCLSSASCI